MKDAKQIRQELWQSLDMVWVRYNFIMMLVIYGICALIFAMTAGSGHTRHEIWTMIGILSVLPVPLLAFFLYRTIQIFRKPESYTFSRCCLSNPKGGSVRDSIKFTVVIEDASGSKFVADTHSIFQTHGAAGLLLEDYVNKTVTVAYNEETGMVVVIG